MAHLRQYEGTKLGGCTALCWRRGRGVTTPSS
ncbi:hypothetical protein V6Z12_A02G174400 [Gossypium hirsutum]